MKKVGRSPFKPLPHPMIGKGRGASVKRNRRSGKLGILRGLSVRQRAFLREKILGSSDKEAALAAGYSPSVAENTKQKIWAKPQVRVEFERLKQRFLANYGQHPTTCVSGT